MTPSPRAGDTAGRPRGRSSILGHPRGSIRGAVACGPCRRHGNRPVRDSHPGLDGAQGAPPTTAHKALVSQLDDRNETRTMRPLDMRRRHTRHTAVVASLR